MWTTEIDGFEKFRESFVEKLRNDDLLKENGMVVMVPEHYNLIMFDIQGEGEEEYMRISNRIQIYDNEGECTEIGEELMEFILNTPGVETVHFMPYTVTITKGDVYSWTEIVEEILEFMKGMEE